MSARYLTPKQVAIMVGRAVGTLASDRYHDCGMPYCRLGKRQIRYKESKVIHFMEKKCKKVYQAEIFGFAINFKERTACNKNQ